MHNKEELVELKALLGKISELGLKTYEPDEANLFYMLGIEHNEVLICRLIKSLIQPDGLHGLGTKPLEMFLQQIGVTDFVELDKAEITLEEKIDNDRRVDIAIYLKDKVIPIEVKIWAMDQESQLHDYYYYYKNRYENFKNHSIDKIYYLTPTGKEPSGISLKGSNAQDGLDTEQVKQISFNKEIKDFLRSLQGKISNESEVGIVIKDFIDVIERMNADMLNRNELQKWIDNTVLNDDELQALLMILKHKEDLWDEIRYKFLRNSLEVQSSYKLEKYENDANFENVDTHCKYVVKDGNNIIAYICIETNLYIARKYDFISNKDGWTKYNKTDYMWKHIKYKGGPSKWNLKDIDFGLTFNLQNSKRKIEWNKYIEE